MSNDIRHDIELFKSFCEKIFKRTKPNVDKDEARAGVLGYHPFALLVFALDFIEALEGERNTLKASHDKLVGLLQDALPLIECLNPRQNCLITEIGETLQALKEAGKL